MKDNKENKANKANNDEKKLSSSFFNTTGKIIGISALGAVLLIAVIIFMVIESSYGKLIVKNKTDINLEYVKATFVNIEGPVSDTLETDNISSSKTLTSPIKPVQILYADTNLEIKFKYENHDEMLTDVGSFNTNFKGNLKITFEKTDDPNLIKLKIKASNGILSTQNIDCDEEYTIDLSEGKILE